MTTQDKILEALREISTRLQSVEAQGRDVIGVLTELRGDFEEHRAHVLDDANRTGEAIRKHEGQIIQVNTAIERLNRAARFPPTKSNGSAG